MHNWQNYAKIVYIYSALSAQGRHTQQNGCQGGRPPYSAATAYKYKINVCAPPSS